jgi:hypothetical protein
VSPAIVTNRGWHRVILTAVSNATNTCRAWEVKWRTQRRTCCSSQGVLTIADGEHLPVWVDGSYGDLRGNTTQCGGCGAVYAARYTARQIPVQAS